MNKILFFLSFLSLLSNDSFAAADPGRRGGGNSNVVFFTGPMTKKEKKKKGKQFDRIITK